MELILVILMFLVGCQTRMPPQQNCHSLRDPATAFNCAATLSEAASIQPPTKLKIDAYFAQLSTYGYDASLRSKYIRAFYKTPLSKTFKSKDPYFTEIFRGLSLAGWLAAKHAQGDPTTNGLTEFGFIIANGEVLPPTDISIVYEKVYERLFSSAKKNGIETSDILLPAIAFYNSKTFEYHFSRPGIDPIPNPAEGWELADNYNQFFPKDFARMIQERKYLLHPSTSLFFHDIGHFVDFVLRPHYMREFRLFIEKKHAALNSITYFRKGFQKFGFAFTRGDLEGFINENLFLPSQANISRIRRLIPKLNPKKFPEPNVIQSEYFGASRKDLIKMASDILEMPYILFESHGGGSRDPNLERGLRVEEVNQGLKEMLTNKGGFVDERHINVTVGEFPDRPQKSNESYLMHEAPGFFMRLKFLLDFAEGKVVPEVIETFLRTEGQNYGFNDQASFLNHLIAINLAEIHFRIQAALSLDITPEDLIKDTALLYEKNGQKKYSKSKTYKYFSTYRPFTTQWFLGYDIARTSR